MRIIVLLLSIIAAAWPQAGRASRVENGLLPAVLIKGRPGEMKLADRMRHYKVPGVSVAVIDGGRVEWARGYGLLEAGGAAPVTPETRFQAASISKPVAAMGALALVEQGKLDLDEDVNRKLVSWKVPENELTKEKKVTLRGLLSHGAGLTVHGFRGYAAGEDVPTLVQALDGQKPANSAAVRVDILPGSKWRYAGGGYNVMQQLMIDVTGKKFPDLMRELVLGKLGMTQSTYEQPLPQALAAVAASGHRGSGEPIKGKWHTYPEMAAAGLWTTPTDLARFAVELQQAYAGKSSKVISPQMAAQMLRTQLAPSGLGIVVNAETQRFEHGGANEGFRCQLVGYLGKGQGAVVMTNGDRGGALVSEILRGVAREYGWPDYRTEERALAEVNPEIYGTYSGEYKTNFTITVTAESGRLYLQAPPLGPERVELFPESETGFFTLSENIKITFVKDERGAVKELIAQPPGGQALKAAKVK